MKGRKLQPVFSEYYSFKNEGDELIGSFTGSGKLVTKFGEREFLFFRTLDGRDVRVIRSSYFNFIDLKVGKYYWIKYVARAGIRKVFDVFEYDDEKSLRSDLLGGENEKKR